MSHEVAVVGHPLLGALVSGLLEPLGVKVWSAPDAPALLKGGGGRQEWPLLLLHAEEGLGPVEQQLEKLQGLGVRFGHLVVVHGDEEEHQVRAAVAARCLALLGLPLDGILLVQAVGEALGQVGRRRAVRVPANMNITFEDFKGIFIEKLHDVSATGMFIEMEWPLEVGTPLRLSCELPDPPGGQVSAWAKVVRRVLPREGAVPGIGIRFVSLEPGQRRCLQRLAEEFQHTSRAGDWRGKLELNAWPNARRQEDCLLESFDRELRLLTRHREQLLQSLQIHLERHLLAHYLSAGRQESQLLQRLFSAWRALAGAGNLAVYGQAGPSGPARLLGAEPATAQLPPLLDEQSLAGGIVGVDGECWLAQPLWPAASRCLATRESLPGAGILLLLAPWRLSPELASGVHRLLRACAAGLGKRLVELAAEPGRLRQFLSALAAGPAPVHD